MEFTEEDYVKHNASQFADQMDRMKLRLPSYSTKYGTATGIVSQQLKDAVWWRYFFTKHEAVPDYGKAWTTLAKHKLSGTGTTATIWPLGQDVSAPPPDVLDGIVPRYRDLVQSIKGQKLIYLLDDGIDMGFEPPVTTIDPTVAMPVLKIVLIGGGHPYITYVRGIYQGIEILVDRGDGKGMVALFSPTNPYYTDNTTLPAVNVSALWKYQAIYLLNDARVGSWCDIVQVTVHGF
jgi:hypothetical protein